MGIFYIGNPFIGFTQKDGCTGDSCTSHSCTAVQCKKFSCNSHHCTGFSTTNGVDDSEEDD